MAVVTTYVYVKSISAQCNAPVDVEFYMDYVVNVPLAMIKDIRECNESELESLARAVGPAAFEQAMRNVTNATWAAASHHGKAGWRAATLPSASGAQPTKKFFMRWLSRMRPGRSIPGSAPKAPDWRDDPRLGLPTKWERR